MYTPIHTYVITAYQMSVKSLDMHFAVKYYEN